MIFVSKKPPNTTQCIMYTAEIVLKYWPTGYKPVVIYGNRFMYCILKCKCCKEYVFFSRQVSHLSSSLSWAVFQQFFFLCIYQDFHIILIKKYLYFGNIRIIGNIYKYQPEQHMSCFWWFLREWHIGHPVHKYITFSWLVFIYFFLF